ncbi:hypothetical protein NDU88_010561 [Pleurodeles waltl]|uniref:Uncharacterized protein n=1 Tax=Pleurodeles waltl TaxID=8319 RepID=A0AAV7S2Z9_PLEWA|nr:hypothetical protein NDU88_010561 [Pleurodeles waltl]
MDTGRTSLSMALHLPEEPDSGAVMEDVDQATSVTVTAAAVEMGSCPDARCFVRAQCHSRSDLKKQSFRDESLAQ